MCKTVEIGKKGDALRYILYMYMYHPGIKNLIKKNPVY